MAITRVYTSIAEDKSQKRSHTKSRLCFFGMKNTLITHSRTKKKMSRPTSTVLKKIRFYQKSITFLCSRLPFDRMMRNISEDIAKSTYSRAPRFTSQSFIILQDVYETHRTSTSETSCLVCKHAKKCLYCPTI
ncbi:histone 3 [Vairimorpha necatrix]|uniref:Histone 3 n=1 Tax=Vairimorpha necatrix TaxID=6039 RepID=A0AAX4J864_9MICR